MFNIKKPLFLNIMILLAYLLTVPLAFRVTGFNFLLELFALTFSVIISAIAVVSLYRHRQWGYPVLFLVFGFMIVNSLFLYHTLKSSFLMNMLISFISLVGFYTSLFGIGKNIDDECPAFDHDTADFPSEENLSHGSHDFSGELQVYDADSQKVSAGSQKVSIGAGSHSDKPSPSSASASPSSKPKKTFEPGRYIASKTGVKFHSPRCIWAKKIAKSRRIWFDDKNSAKKKGLKPCACVR